MQGSGFDLNTAPDNAAVSSKPYADTRKKYKSIKDLDRAIIRRLPAEEAKLLLKLCQQRKRQDDVMWRRGSLKFVTRKDLQEMLKLKTFTQGHIIEAYVDTMVRQYAALGTAPTCVLIDSTFAWLVDRKQFKSIDGLFAKAFDGVTSCKYVLTWIELHNHWLMLVGEVDAKILTIMNSLRGYYKQQIATKMKEIIKQFVAQLERHLNIPTSSWTLVDCAECPQQPADSNDCGVYVLKWLEGIMNGTDLIATSADPEEVHMMRAQCVLTILQDPHAYIDAV